MRRNVQDPKLPKAWVELFLAVSDLLDGHYHKDFRESLQRAYNEVWDKSGGRLLYTKAVEERNLDFFQKT